MSHTTNYANKVFKNMLAASLPPQSAYTRNGWTLAFSVVPVVNDDDLIAVSILQDGGDGKTFMVETDKLRAMLAEIGIIEGVERARVCATESWET